MIANIIFKIFLPSSSVLIAGASLGLFNLQRLYSIEAYTTIASTLERAVSLSLR